MSDVEFKMDAKLYEAIAGEDGPCGPSLSEDESFAEFRAAGTGRPERYDPVLGKEIPAEPPNWQRVASLGIELALRSKDAAILAPLVNAMAATRGAEGAASALHLLRECLAAHWGELHPLPDEEGDYFERMAILRGLSGGATLAKLLETAPVYRSPRAGPITLRTLSIAAGETTPRDSEAVFDPDQLARMFEEEEGAAEAAARALRAAAEARAHLEAIAEFVSEQEGAALISFAEAEAVLGRLATLLAPFVGEAEEAVAEAAAEPEEESVAPTHAAGDVADRDEALALIDAVVRWYAENARSSPVPLILLKIRNLIGADFAAVVDAVAPKGWDNAALTLGDIDGKALDAAAPGDAATAVSNSGGDTVARAALDGMVSGLDALDAAIAARLSAADPASGDTKGGREEGDADKDEPDAQKEASDAAGSASDDCADLVAAAETLRAGLARFTESAAPCANPGSAAPALGQIRNRGDVSQAIDRLAKYFSTHEPSSPVSGFLQRANSFVNRGFVDIVKELAPQGRANAELRLTPGSSPQSGAATSSEAKKGEAKKSEAKKDEAKKDEA